MSVSCMKIYMVKKSTTNYAVAVNQLGNTSSPMMIEVKQHSLGNYLDGRLFQALSGYSR